MISGVIAILLFVILPLSAAIKLPLLAQALILVLIAFWIKKCNRSELEGVFDWLLFWGIALIMAVGNIFYYFQYYDTTTGYSVGQFVRWIFRP